MGDAEIIDLISAIASDPVAGALIPGTGGARKVRHAGRGKGRSGDYRTIHYFAATDVPVFLLALVDKGQRADLSHQERNELAATLPNIAGAYRIGVERRAGRRREPGKP